MKNKRNENVRNNCDKINYFTDKLFYCVGLGKVNLAKYYWKEIKTITHRIKRTTWRGEEKKVIYRYEHKPAFDEPILIKKILVSSLPTKPSAKISCGINTSFCPVCFDIGTERKIRKHKCRGYKVVPRLNCKNKKEYGSLNNCGFFTD